MTTQGQDVLRFLAMTTLAIPSMMALIAPIALLIASIHVLNRLNGDSELIVMTAGGMPVWSLLKPFGLLALLVSLGVAFVNHVAGPWAQQKLKELAVQVRTDLMAQVIQPWRFTSPEAKLTVHIRDRAPNGELLGLMMHDARDPKQVVTYLAERGRIIKQGDGGLSAHGEGPHRAPPGERAVPADHRLRALCGGHQPARAAHRQVVRSLRPRERYTGELLRPDPNDPSTRRIPAASPPSCTSAVQPLLRFRLRADGAGLHGPGPDHAHEPHAGASSRPSASPSCCRIVGIAAANAAVVRTSAAVPLLYAVPVAAAAGRRRS